MKRLIPAVAILLFAAPAQAAPPEFEIDPVIHAPKGQYLEIAPKTDAVSVVYVSPHLAPFPAHRLVDKTVLIVYIETAANEGDYNCWAVAASKTGEQVKVPFVIRIGKPPTGPPPPPPVAAKHLTFVGVDAATASVANDTGLREWLKAAGVKVYVVSSPSLLPANFRAAVEKAGGPPAVVVQGADGKVLNQAKISTVAAVKELFK